jgi:UDP-N-acetylglucosamine transferase subunit ALG13
MSIVQKCCMKTLFVASAGGHLEELWLLHPRFRNVTRAHTWVTWDSAHSRSLLKDEQCIFIEKSRPRDVMTALHNARQAKEILDSADWSCVVSTGSLPAVPFFAVARARNIPCHFIESAARVQGPSLSARMLERLPGVHRYSQHKTWSGRRNWQFEGSVFDAFSPTATAPREIKKAVVTLGTNSYGFRRLIKGIRDVLPPDAEVLWQTGYTDVSGLGIAAEPFLPAEELRSAMESADLVVAHSGVGSALAAIQSGHVPLLIPRRKRHGEHIDDHQVQIARDLVHKGIAVACDADHLNRDILAVASGLQVEPVPAPTFVLDDSLAQEGVDFLPRAAARPFELRASA